MRAKILSQRETNIEVTPFVHSIIDLISNKRHIDPNEIRIIGFVQTTRFATTVLVYNKHIFPISEGRTEDHIFNTGDLKTVTEYIEYLERKGVEN
jgi:hypothetical protein